MQTHSNILGAASDVPFAIRVPLLCKAAGLTFAAIERETGLTRGCISRAAGGQLYAYPKLREALVSSLAARLDESVEDVRRVLFPEEGS